MISKKIALIGLVLLCLVQLYLVGAMVTGHEQTIVDGTEYKFRTVPVDPNDPLRGKYITLSFTDAVINVKSAKDWEDLKRVYAIVQNDINGYAQLTSLSKAVPVTQMDYLQVQIVSIIDAPSEQKVFLQLPFDRFYLEETKAPEAERAFRSRSRDIEAPTYALVSIKDGKAVLTDVIIAGRSATDLSK
jgi:uncharacterized membrane-anchored protein